MCRSPCRLNFGCTFGRANCPIKPGKTEWNLLSRRFAPTRCGVAQYSCVAAGRSTSVSKITLNLPEKSGIWCSRLAKHHQQADG